jgi:hypothetical protein
MQRIWKVRWTAVLSVGLCALLASNAVAQRNGRGDNPRSPSDRRGLPRADAPQLPPGAADDEVGGRPEELPAEWQGDGSDPWGSYDQGPPSPDACDWTLGCSPCRDSRYNRSVILGRLWTNLEILGWATKGSDLAPLATSSPVDPLTPVADAVGPGDYGHPVRRR